MSYQSFYQYTFFPGLNEFSKIFLMVCCILSARIKWLKGQGSDVLCILPSWLWHIFWPTFFVTAFDISEALLNFLFGFCPLFASVWVFFIALQVHSSHSLDFFIEISHFLPNFFVFSFKFFNFLIINVYSSCLLILSSLSFLALFILIDFSPGTDHISAPSPT